MNLKMAIIEVNICNLGQVKHHMLSIQFLAKCPHRKTTIMKKSWVFFSPHLFYARFFTKTLPFPGLLLQPLLGFLSEIPPPTKRISHLYFYWQLIKMSYFVLFPHPLPPLIFQNIFLTPAV